MAADLLILGLEVVAAVTAALIAVILLRGPARALFGSRAAYCLWLAVPLMAAAVLLPRPAATAQPAAPIAARVVERAAAAPAAVPAPVAVAPIGLPQSPALSIDPGELAVPLLALWALGAAGFVAALAFGQQRFLRSLGALRVEWRAGGPVFHAARPDVGPALVGALSPRVVLPSDFAERFTPEEQAVVVAHERVHLALGDAQINLTVAAVRALFWFHPLVHLGARLVRADQELACDESVIARHPDARRVYAEAMLKTQLVAGPVPIGCHWLSGGKTELRRRIVRLALTPRPLRRLTGAVAAAALAVTGGAAAWACQPASAIQSGPASASARQLTAAIQEGRNTEAAEMIRSGADVDAWVMGEGTPLLLAVRNGQLDLARLLLEAGANPDRMAPGDGAPLIAAANEGDLAMVRLLLEHRADPNVSVTGDGNPLIAAAGAGHVEILDLLLASGAQVDAIVPSDETALITAARHGQLDTVKRLVEAGADVNLSVRTPRVDGSELRSPLGMARRAGRDDIVDYLRAHGARA